MRLRSLLTGILGLTSSFQGPTFKFSPNNRPRTLVKRGLQPHGGDYSLNYAKNVEQIARNSGIQVGIEYPYCFEPWLKQVDGLVEIIRERPDLRYAYTERVMDEVVEYVDTREPDMTQKRQVIKMALEKMLYIFHAFTPKTKDGDHISEISEAYNFYADSAHAMGCEFLSKRNTQNEDEENIEVVNSIILEAGKIIPQIFNRLKSQA
ncbi:MAG: hypothetical protein AAF621_05585, partial [Pseudomonadota bacterium]